jgi:hypothetical protein
LISVHLCDFIKRTVQVCVKNTLAQLQVLVPSAPLERLAEEALSQEYLDDVERACNTLGVTL